MITVSDKPKFEHDCTECQFLGHADFGNRARGADMYIHCNPSGKRSYIARRSSKGDDYDCITQEELRYYNTGVYQLIHHLWLMSKHSEQRDQG